MKSVDTGLVFFGVMFLTKNTFYFLGNAPSEEIALQGRQTNSADGPIAAFGLIQRKD